MSRVEMIPNRYNLGQQIINYMNNIDFSLFLETNAAAKTYFEDLNEEQKWQYQEDFWYFVGLASSVAQPLTKIPFPEHKKLIKQTI